MEHRNHNCFPATIGTLGGGEYDLVEGYSSHENPASYNTSEPTSNLEAWLACLPADCSISRSAACSVFNESDTDVSGSGHACNSAARNCCARAVAQPYEYGNADFVDIAMVFDEIRRSEVWRLAYEPVCLPAMQSVRAFTSTGTGRILPCTAGGRDNRAGPAGTSLYTADDIILENIRLNDQLEVDDRDAQIPSLQVDRVPVLLGLPGGQMQQRVCNQKEASLSRRDAPSSSSYTPRELVYLAAAMHPVRQAQQDAESKQQRGGGTKAGLRISTEPQSVAARHRRARIREKLRVLQGLVPGGSSLDTASMLEEALQYIAFLKMEVEALRQGNSRLLP